MANSIDSTPEFVGQVYKNMTDTLQVVRRLLGRPMTLSEKILLSHLEDVGRLGPVSAVGSDAIPFTGGNFTGPHRHPA